MNKKEEKEIDIVFKSSLTAEVYSLIKKLADEKGGYDCLPVNDLMDAASAANTPVVSDLIDYFGLAHHDYIMSADFAIVDWYIYYALRDGVETVDIQDIISRNVWAKFDDFCKFSTSATLLEDNLIDLVVHQLAGVKIVAMVSDSIKGEGSHG
jgi:hypothetical protein